MAAAAPESTEPDRSESGQQAPAWDLEPLVDGEGAEGVERRLAEALQRAQAFAERYAGQARRARQRTGCARRCWSWPRSTSSSGAPALRSAALRHRHGRAGQRGACCSCAQEQRARRSRRRCCSSSWSGRRSTDERAEELLAGDGLDFCTPSPAQRAPLPRAPALRARGEDPRREVADRRRRLDAAVRGADLGDRGPSCPTRREVALDVALSRLSLRRSRDAAHDRRGRHRGARAGAAHARIPVQHAARRQGDRRPPAPLPALAGCAQPRQRGQRRVRAGADRGRARAL